MDVRPWKSGKFLISAGLKPLDSRPVFLPEENLEPYLKNKQQARSENLEKYYPHPQGLSDSELTQVAQVLREHLKRDLPDFVMRTDLPHRDEVDLILSQVPEDFSVWKMQSQKEWLALIHLCSPNHWSAEDKIGKSFTEAHEPIPYIDAISKAAAKMFEQVQKRGAMERFAWGVATDNRLNHHPQAPQGILEEEWKGRSFDPSRPELYVRIERQTIFPISPEMNGFTIKTSFIQVSTLPSEDLQLIHQSILGMDESILRYKGLFQDQNIILDWLSSLMT